MLVKKIVDSHGRVIRKLRISLTDRCNFRCGYCMPVDAKFMPKDQHLSAAELIRIVSHLVDMGVDHIRVSGGEPTLRHDFESIMLGLGKLNIKKFGITSNGWDLYKWKDLLLECGCTNINISLDSLKKERFEAITNSKKYDHVMKSIKAFNCEPFKLKINTVVMRGCNEDELLDFVKWSEESGISVRFLELIKLGCGVDRHDEQFISALDMKRVIEEQFELRSEFSELDSTSINYQSRRGGKIGFIASESMPFCGNCSRLRLTAKGELRPCLMKSTGISVKNLDEQDLKLSIAKLLPEKPMLRQPQFGEKMYTIGG